MARAMRTKMKKELGVETRKPGDEKEERTDLNNLKPLGNHTSLHLTGEGFSTENRQKRRLWSLWLLYYALI